MRADLGAGLRPMPQKVGALNDFEDSLSNRSHDSRPVDFFAPRILAPFNWRYTWLALRQFY